MIWDVKFFLVWTDFVVILYIFLRNRSRPFLIIDWQNKILKFWDHRYFKQINFIIKSASAWISIESIVVRQSELWHSCARNHVSKSVTCNRTNFNWLIKQIKCENGHEKCIKFIVNITCITNITALIASTITISRRGGWVIYWCWWFMLIFFKIFWWCKGDGHNNKLKWKKASD